MNPNVMLKILQGDCLLKLLEIESGSIHCCVTDPPYHLTTGKKGGSGPASLNVNSPAGRARISTGFMGKAWDGGDVAQRPETWQAVLRVLKPGAHLLAFGGTRTFHRMTCAIEDAGFEIRDTVMWVYGSGFPKSHNLEGDWEGWGSALKPAWEPIVLAKKPFAGTVAENVAKHGTGAMNIGASRVPLDGGYKCKANGRPSQTGLGDRYNADLANQPNTLGRWPANLIHDGSEEVTECFPNAPGQIADAKLDGEGRKKQNCYGAMRRGRSDEPSANSDNEGSVGFQMKPGQRRIDSGSAARFFYCAKASSSERGEDNTHPTVKPIALMSYLVRLVCPPGGTVLDPFAGSGTTGVAAIAAGFNCVLIERNLEYISIIRSRTDITPGLPLTHP